jgi:hypothetical protein
MRRSASMIFAERSRPAGPACAAKVMEAKSLSRAQGSMFASEASNPRSGLDIDAEHGSGTADPEDSETECVNPIALWGRAGDGGRAALASFFSDFLFDGAARIACERRATPRPNPPPQGGREPSRSRSDSPRRKVAR